MVAPPPDRTINRKSSCLIYTTNDSLVSVAYRLPETIEQFDGPQFRLWYILAFQRSCVQHLQETSTSTGRRSPWIVRQLESVSLRSIGHSYETRMNQQRFCDSLQLKD
jgi:hypothetical protein